MKKQIDVTAAIIVKDKKVFAARRKTGAHLAGFWEFPGGKVEKGESPKTAAIREVKEETGVVLQENEIEKLKNYQFNMGDRDILIMVFIYQDFEIYWISGGFFVSNY